MILGSGPLLSRAILRHFLLVTRRNFKNPENLFDSSVWASNSDNFLSGNATDPLAASPLFGARQSIGKPGLNFMTIWVDNPYYSIIIYVQIMSQPCAYNHPRYPKNATYNRRRNKI